MPKTVPRSQQMYRSFSYFVSVLYPSLPSAGNIDEKRGIHNLAGGQHIHTLPPFSLQSNTQRSSFSFSLLHSLHLTHSLTLRLTRLTTVIRFISRRLVSSSPHSLRTRVLSLRRLSEGSRPTRRSFSSGTPESLLGKSLGEAFTTFWMEILAWNRLKSGVFGLKFIESCSKIVQTWGFWYRFALNEAFGPKIAVFGLKFWRKLL